MSRPMPPLVVCVRCHHVGVPGVTPARGDAATALVLWVLGVLPGLIYSLWSASTAGRAACRSCGAVELVPTESQRARELLGAGADKAIHLARMGAAVEWARILAEQDNLRREGNRSAAIAALILVVALGSGAAWFGWQFHQDAKAERERDEASRPDDAAVEAQAKAAADKAEAETEALKAWLGNPTQAEPVVIAISALAYAEPSAESEPLLRVTAGERYLVAERRDGFARLADAPDGVVAWVSESSLSR